MTTAVKTKTPKAPDISGDLRLIRSELNVEFFERREVIDALMLCILSKSHGFLLGLPGTGKSALISNLCNRINGANFFDVLLDRQLGKEDLFGPTDIGLYEQTSRNGGKGIWQRDIEGYLPWCHIGFGDEVGKAGPAVTNQLLWAMNERRFRNGKIVLDIPMISFFGASNEMLEMPEQAALFDRYLVRVDVDYIEESGHFKSYLDTAVLLSKPTRTTVELGDLLNVIENVIPTITIPVGILDNLVALRSKLRTEHEVRPSDRRWKAAMRLLQASAYLNGRTVVDEDDLTILAHVLWEDPVKASIVGQEVNSITSEFNKAAVMIEREVAELLVNTRAQKGKAVNSRSEFGTQTKHKIDTRDAELRALIEKANRQGRNTDKLEVVRDSLKTLKVAVFTICLGMSEAKAEHNASKPSA